jgi:hypothetical protein
MKSCWLRSLAIATVSLLAACAPSAPLLKATTHLDASKGIVFGRLPVERDGQPVVTDIHRNLLKPSVLLNLSPYVGPEKLNTNAWAPGKWSVEASLLDGANFAIVLPAGRYYVVEFDYFDLYPSPAGGLLAARSYVSESGMWTTNSRSVFTFEVVAGEAMYLGDIASRFVASTARPGLVSWDIRVEDGRAASLAWFHETYPAMPLPGVRLAEKQPY